MRPQNGMSAPSRSACVARMNVVDILKDIDIAEMRYMKSMIMRLLQSTYGSRVDVVNKDIR